MLIPITKLADLKGKGATTKESSSTQKDRQQERMNFKLQNNQKTIKWQ